MKPRLPLKCIGLTGGIASGKSLVSEYLQSAGVAVMNLDEIGREVTDMNKGLQQEIQKICATRIIDDHGVLDRNRIREVIFSDPSKRKVIEALLHPAILKNFEKECIALARSGRTIVVCEAALLIESGYHRHLDGLVVVTAPLEDRKKRLMERDGISEDLAEKVIRTQLGDAEKIKLASIIIENNGTKEELKGHVRQLMHAWRLEYGTKGRDQ